MDDEWGREERGWDDRPDSDDDTDRVPASKGSGAAVLTAVFEDGPPSKMDHVLQIVDSPYVGWPIQCEWIHKMHDEPAVHYLYTHIGGGHYRVTSVRPLEETVDYSSMIEDM